MFSLIIQRKSTLKIYTLYLYKVMIEQIDISGTNCIWQLLNILLIIGFCM